MWVSNPPLTQPLPLSSISPTPFLPLTPQFFSFSPFHDDMCETTATRFNAENSNRNQYKFESAG